jgi:hypothetical protein
MNAVACNLNINSVLSGSRSLAATFSLLHISIFLAAMCLAGRTLAADIYSEPRPRGGSYLFIEGRILPGDEQKFAGWNLTPPVYVRPSGPGGNVMTAFDIADTIQKRGYNTLLQNVDGVCASACVLIWLAGRHAIVQNNGILCFHRAYDPQTGKSDIEFDRYAAGKLMSYGLNRQQAWTLVTTEMPDHDCQVGTKWWAVQMGFTWQTLWSLFGASGCSAKFCLLVP